MVTNRYIKIPLLISVVLFICSLMQGAWAIDVNKVVESCANCHGKAGASTETDMPIIGGYSIEFLSNNLRAYKNKERECPDTKYRAGSKKGTKTNMCEMVKNLNDNDIQLVAKYFAKQKFVRAKQKFDPALAAKGKELHDMYCEKCHSEGGTVSKDDAGMPAGQWLAYLKQAFDEFNSGKRPVAKKMKLKMDELNDADIDALINFYASFQ